METSVSVIDDTMGAGLDGEGQGCASCGNPIRCSDIDACARRSTVIVTSLPTLAEREAAYDELIALGVSPGLAASLTNHTP